MTDDATPQDWKPAFPRRRPPFEPGNEAAVKHGARSPRKVEEMARQILNSEIYTRYPHLQDFPEAVGSLARIEAVARLLFADIAKGAYTPDGVFKASQIARFISAENTNAKLRASLGMSPASEAEVMRDRAAAASTTVDVVAELVRQGRATRSQQPAGRASEPAETEGENDAHR